MSEKRVTVRELFAVDVEGIDCNGAVIAMRVGSQKYL